MPGPRTAFVYLHAQAGPDYFADVPYAWTAGELRKAKMLLPGISYARKRSKGGTTPYWGEQYMVSAEFGWKSAMSSALWVSSQL